jgi:hypothetical protein
MQLHSMSLIYGFSIGVQYEDLTEEDGNEYLIVSLGVLEIIFNW